MLIHLITRLTLNHRGHTLYSQNFQSYLSCQAYWSTFVNFNNDKNLGKINKKITSGWIKYLLHITASLINKKIFYRDLLRGQSIIHSFCS